MSLDLHPSCTERLIRILANRIEQLKVLYGVYLGWVSAEEAAELDSALPRRDKRSIHPLDVIDERPASEFCIDQIQRILDVVGKFDNEDRSEKPLIGYERFAHPKTCAQEIIKSFDTLPWNYVFSMRLPRAISEGLAKIIADDGKKDISIDVCVVTDKAFPFARQASETGFTQNALGLFSRLDPRWYPTDGCFLQYHSNGYVNLAGSTSTALTAVEMLQSFIGLGTALRMFAYSPTHNPAANSQPFINNQVHRFLDGKYIFDTTFSLDPSVIMALDGFEIVEYGEDFPIRSLVNHVFGKMAVCYSRPKEAERVIRSAQWLAKSYMSRNGTMSFVEAMIAIEILLGEKNTTDVIGISALLSNRCAYLIGESQADREKILADFRSLYLVRSNIVHSGKSRLSRAELIQLFQLRHICERAIRAEIELIAKDAVS